MSYASFIKKSLLLMSFSTVICGRGWDGTTVEAQPHLASIGLFVVTRNNPRGRIFAAHMNETIGAVKNRVEAIEGLPVNQRILWSLVRYRNRTRPHILSNNQVLANCNNQPGDYFRLERA